MEIRNLPKPTELKFHVDSVILEAIVAAEKFFLSNVCIELNQVGQPRNI